MTRDDAVEVVLRGNHWRPCFKCKGAGQLVVAPAINIINDPMKSTMKKCAYCDGRGHWAPFLSRLAYETLGLGYPPKPHNDPEKYAQATDEFLKEYRDNFISSTKVLTSLTGLSAAIVSTPTPLPAKDD